MYVNIGEDLSLRDGSVIGIFDPEKLRQSKRTRPFLRRVEEEGLCVSVGEGEAKALVLTAEYGMERVYRTQLGAAALERRLRAGKTGK